MESGLLMKNKILLISNMYPSEESLLYGIFVKNFENNMNNYGFDLSNKIVMTKNKNGKLSKIIKYIEFFRSIIKAIKSNEYDVIYVHYITYSLLPFLFVKKYIKKPLLLNAHGTDVLSNSLIARLIRKLVTPLIESADTIIVPSNYFKDIVSKKFFIDDKRIFISPSGGIDISIFHPFEVGKTDTKFIFGYISRIDNGKGWDTLLYAVKKLSEQNILNFEVHIIGGGSEESKMKNAINELNIGNYIKYFGQKEHTKLAFYYNQMDVFIFPTKMNESLGLVGLEAMACGTPVIGSNIGGLREYIKHDYNGKLFNAGDSDELSTRMKEMINENDSVMKKYSMNALSKALEYNAVDVNKKLKQKIEELV
jgi:L-malate glycosyltransferase